jgi:hypothetical protein
VTSGCLRGQNRESTDPRFEIDWRELERHLTGRFLLPSYMCDITPDLIGPEYATPAMHCAHLPSGGWTAVLDAI